MNDFWQLPEIIVSEILDWIKSRENLYRQFWAVEGMSKVEVQAFKRQVVLAEKLSSATRSGSLSFSFSHSCQEKGTGP